MDRIDHLRLMATYNEWMNDRLFQAADSLTGNELAADRGAFFRSVLGTLNHLVVADTIWLKRFARHPANYSALEPILELEAPKSLDQLIYSDFRELSAHRKWLDNLIKDWVASICEPELDHCLNYASMQGVAASKNFFGLLMHFFNHQTHHRGQVSTLLCQAGLDPGVTDLLMLIPNE